MEWLINKLFILINILLLEMNKKNKLMENQIYLYLMVLLFNL